MARKPLVTTHEPTPEIALRPDAAAPANLMAAVQTSYDDERDLANQLWGQIQMADAIAKLTTVVGLTKLKEIKESKLYRAFSGKSAVDREGNKIPDVGTWDGFCRALGTSANKVDEDLLNLRVFGEEAMENLSRIGAGYRELRQFRRLPEDQKTALIEVAKTGDKDSFLELAEDLIAKHAKEKESLTQRAEEAEANLEARSRVLEDKNSKIDQLTEEVAKIKKRVKALPPADVGEEIRKEVTTLAAQAEVGIRAMRAGLQALADHTEAHGIDHGDFTAGLICQLELTLRQLRSEFDVKTAPDGDDTPEWMRPGASEAAATRVAADMAAAGWKRDAEGRMVRADAETLGA
ncbi:hypothetical protein BLA13014_07353 [Burkholderia aenigmatica]|jgi:hypothetical protein|uniref:DUF3102 domain-containing protein n=1 Tax=Burkholderia aenigmatica TaxID=2015348 RepID=A0A6P2STQ2_9BURK|nr:hypothetical protein [Burkholderia aenigmatica]VWC46896.1 hypothetical protein BLA13014_07353 [Burkholderia aenigmatica]